MNTSRITSPQRFRSISLTRISNRFRQARTSGFTLIELAVTLTLAGVLMALLLPAIQAAREASRRAQCVNNLKQLALAVHSYESVFMLVPAGNVNGRSAIASLLPYLENVSMYQHYFTSDVLPHPASTVSATMTAYQLSLPILICPSDSASSLSTPFAATNYGMNWGSGVQKYGYNGFFRPCVPDPLLPTGFVRFSDVQDGYSNTALFGEILAADGRLSRLRTVWNLPMSLSLPSDYEMFATTCRDLSVASGASSFVRGRPWAYGDILNTAYTHIIGPNQPNCLNGNSVQPGSYSSGSEHSGGANVIFGDGHAVFISNHVSLSVWRAFGSRNGSD